MSIYRLYTENGHRAGFWVQHRHWKNTCAQVQSIAGQCRGTLPGRAPLHDSAEVVLLAFDVRSGRPIELGTSVEPPQDRNYARIAEPAWSQRVPLTKVLQPG